MNILANKLLILASAGSGKTFQLSNRIIGLVAQGKEPRKIVALTFTRKAAGEFADAVLSKLAKAADDAEEASALAEATDAEAGRFPELLKEVVGDLHRLTLGTMDSFFARIVKNFQYELGLTGGPFQLLEGPRAEAAREEIIDAILASTVDDRTSEDFVQAFRRSNIGKEGVKVTESLTDFVDDWLGHFRSLPDHEWGPVWICGTPVEEWEKRKADLAGRVRAGLDDISYNRKGQREAFEKAIDTIERHTVGSGSLGKGGNLLETIFECAATPGAAMEPKFYNTFLVPGPAGEALRELVSLVAQCEMSAALVRTRAIRDVVEVFDRRCDAELRRNGLLGFDDVKFLMGEWARSEEARVLRDAVDFRLDSRHDHWLLDEFQDTSGEQWNGLVPLMDEAGLYREESTMFIVGDRKQAIYGWRGGDVGVFDKAVERYGAGYEGKPAMVTETMAESWRSCPEVLELVNRIGGDKETLSELFGGTAERWEWEDHYPAEKIAGKAGHARVEVLENADDRYPRLEAILRELGVGEKRMSCGILVRSNAKVREIADFLRPLGFDVIEEGEREPAMDNPVGIALLHLLKWLADPSDKYSERVIEMSPLDGVLKERYAGVWQKAWESLLEEAAEKGFAEMAAGLIRTLAPGWSDFGRRRANDIVAALEKFDEQGGATPREAVDWISRLRISQSPGVAAVQVMTIHKSKGLGFDVVVLPDVPDVKIPDRGHFKAAVCDGWICSPPPDWVRRFFPEFVAAEEKWADGQCYEAMCLLYVAITRAKRGLHILLTPPPPSRKEDPVSMTTWIARAVGSEGAPGMAFAAGSVDWVRELPDLEKEGKEAGLPRLANAVPRRNRTTPSGEKKAVFTGLGSVGGMKVGNEVHAAFEGIGWIDEERPVLPEGEIGAKIAALLAEEKVAALFRREGKNIMLLREQPVEAILDGKWLSGAIDRLHVHRDGAGKVTKVEVIDFKTDGVKSAAELIERYAGQMEAYRRVMGKVYGVAVECLLVSTALKAVIPV